ncbi:cramped chromatin regulator [Haematobia irritans]|uniref:cramped chromatin regulator n=1 Tax=Haematobia irritans TaxID=7368 RepID=UPI003F4FC790
MDKGQLANPPIAAASCNKDDVVAVTVTKKEKSHSATTETNDAAIVTSQTKTTLAATRGKDINEKKGEGKHHISEFHSDTEELLGSVTTYNCHGTRTSARVIQKMRQDQQTRPTTPPPAERENTRKDERASSQKTPSQVRANRPTWSNVERNHFFDALNEFGKDFEAIGNFINSKLKRRSPAVDVSFKSKDQVRQHYYQTYHKICKYVRFSEEVRKPAQELYALINYGEMRRKLQFVTDKHFMKLKNLVYHGHVTVRCKGKNIRIKTPSCKALRRLNQLDDSLEDIRLPSKIEVLISPLNMEAFGRVQTIAQNPRCRTTVPLHKKLVNFINMFQHKWRSMDVRVSEEAKLLNTSETQNTSNAQAMDNQIHDSEICFLPKPGVVIHRPLLSITEYLSSVNICLTAYEERMGITVRGEMLNAERHNTTSANAINTSIATQSSTPSTTTSNKRSRTESGSEKKSPDHNKRTKSAENISEIAIQSSMEDIPSATPLSLTEMESLPCGKQEISCDELSDEIHELLSDPIELNVTKEETTPAPVEKNSAQLQTQINTTIPADISLTTTPQVTSVRAKSSRNTNSKSSRSVFKPLLNDDVIQRIRSGWTASKAGDITIGDLYVVLGHDSKLELDYYWLPENKSNIESHPSSCYGLGTEGADMELKEPTVLSNKLKQLLLIANLSDRMRKRPCNCDRNSVVKSRFERDFAARGCMANKSLYGTSNIGVKQSDTNSGMFRQPMVPYRRTTIDPVKQLTTLTRQKMSRQILVQRLLLPSNGYANTTTSINSANNNNHNPGILPSSPSIRNTSQVPWNSTTKATITTTIVPAPSHTKNNTGTDSQELSAFLDSLNNESQTISEIPSEVETSRNEKQTNLEETGDRTDGPTSVHSVDSAFDESSNTSFLNGLTPMHLIRDSTSNSRWLEDNINDFSLTSLLGHLDDINAGRDILDPSSTMSVISESSVDYMHKFQEISALLQSQEKD